jgi:transcriptional regulator with XRE-family HTH domain
MSTKPENLHEASEVKFYSYAQARPLLELVEEWLTQPGRTSTELARLSGIDRSLLSHFRAGRRRYPQLDTIEKLAVALEVPLEAVREYWNIKLLPKAAIEPGSWQEAFDRWVEANNSSYKELAQRTGLSLQALYRIKSGTFHPWRTTLDKLVAAGVILPAIAPTKEELNSWLGQALEGWIRVNNSSYQELSTKTGLSLVMLYRLKNGRYTPTPSTLRKLAEVGISRKAANLIEIGQAASQDNQAQVRQAVEEWLTLPGNYPAKLVRQTGLTFATLQKLRAGKVELRHKTLNKLVKAGIVPTYLSSIF